MSDNNYPRVYGHCDAGCKRQVPSREEYEATRVIVKDKDGNVIKNIVLEVDETTGSLNIKTSTT